MSSSGKRFDVRAPSSDRVLFGQVLPAESAPGVGADRRAAARTASTARFVAAVRGSPWTAIGGRVLLVLAGLFVLAWVGRASPRWLVGSAPLVAPSASESPRASEPPREVVDAAAPPPVVAVAAPAVTHARATTEDPVFVNYAGPEELKRLPGVGAKRAEAIVALRQRIGRFQRVEDLLRVKGIGRATLRKWRPLVRLDAPAASIGPAADGGR